MDSVARLAAVRAQGCIRATATTDDLQALAPSSTPPGRRSGRRPATAASACRAARPRCPGRSLSAPRRRCTEAENAGATPANRAPARSPSGATSTSARLRSIARTIARRDLLRRARADARRQLRARVGEHPGVADEAREHARDADAGGREVLAQAEREAAQPELRRRVQRRVRPGRLARERRDEHELPGPARRERLGEQPRELDRRAQVHRERPVDLLGRERGRARRSPAAPRWRRARRVARRRRAAAPGASGSTRSAAIARPPSSAASASSGSARRPVRMTRAPRAASARAAAPPMPPVAPVSRTVRPSSFTRTRRRSP